MRLRTAWVLWFIAAIIIGGCAGTASVTLPSVSGWLVAALGIATLGAALLTSDYLNGARRDRPRR